MTTTPVREWAQRACVGLGTEVFFPPKDSPDAGPPNRWELAALTVCGQCRVRGVCLEAALEFPAAEQHGVVGGMTAGQRRKVLQARRRRPTTRSYLDGLSGLATGARVEPGVDGLTVTRLMAGESVPGATRAEAAHAAVMLHRCGYGTRWIAARLGEHERQVDRWKARYEAGEPLVRGPGGRAPSGAGAAA